MAKTDIDIKAVMSGFKTGVRDLLDGVERQVEAALAQAKEAEARRDKATTEVMQELTKRDVLKAEIAQLAPQAQALGSRVEALKKAIAAVTAVSL